MNDPRKIFLISCGLILSSLCSLEAKAKNPVVKDFLRWSGSFSQTGSSAAFATLLNNKIPDVTMWMRSTLDLNLDGNTSDDTASFHATFRQKSYCGAHAMKTEKSQIKIGDSLSASHDHPIQKPSLWLKSAWFDFKFDSFLNDNIAKHNGFNRLRIGYFPFQLGRGIALGDSFGTSQEFLGIFIRSNDYFMPGIMIYGESPTQSFDYKLYFGLPESNCASAAKVLSFSKEHLIEKEGLLPFNGTFNDDLVFAAQAGINLKIDESIIDNENNQFLKLNGYGLAFFAPDKTVVMNCDTKINLYTAGFCFDYSSDILDIGFDCAFNFGSQIIRSADQNKVSAPQLDEQGYFVQTYSHIIDAETNKPALLTAALKQELAKNLHRNDESFTVDGKTYNVSSERILKSYENTFRGKMAVIDCSLKFEDFGGTISGILGYASGDKNPNENPIDAVYKGFISINQSFESTKVPSAILLNGAVRRPMTLASDSKPILKDYLEGSFCDLAFAGAGIMYVPAWSQEKQGKLSTNLLVFMNDHQGNKLLPNSNPYELPEKVSSTKASKFLGTEYNFMFEFKPIKNLKLGFTAACFFPGQYYLDIKGARFDDAVTKQLNTLDADAIVKNKYSTSNDNIYVISIEAKYLF